jgi:hypothetical protein
LHTAREKELALTLVLGYVPILHADAEHAYKVEVAGGDIRLSIDGTLVGAFSDSSLSSGGIGFALKSTGAANTVEINQVAVRTINSR